MIDKPLYKKVKICNIATLLQSCYFRAELYKFKRVTRLNLETAAYSKKFKIKNKS